VSQLKDGAWYAYQTATVGRGIDLVFIGEGFTSADITAGLYESYMYTAIEGFFEAQPYKAYRHYFNAYIVGAESVKKGVDSNGLPRHTKFGTDSSGDNEISYDLCFEYASKAPIFHIDSSQVVLVVNYPRAGWCNWTDQKKCVAVCWANFELKGTVRHEAGGHGFAKLGDEYVTRYGETFPETYHQSWINSHNIGSGLNVDITNDPSKVVWRDFIGHPKYPMVGIFEGANTYEKGIWRSEENSIMRSWRTLPFPYFNAISRYAIIKRIKGQAGEPFSMEWFMANDVIEPLK